MMFSAGDAPGATSGLAIAWAWQDPRGAIAMPVEAIVPPRPAPTGHPEPQRPCLVTLFPEIR